MSRRHDASGAKDVLLLIGKLPVKAADYAARAFRAVGVQFHGSN